MTACRYWRDSLLDSALEALSTTAARSLEDHLRQCPACAAAAADLLLRRRQMDAALTQLVRSAEPSPDFRARVLAAAARARPVFPGLAWQGALAAAAALLLAGVLLPSLGPRLAGRPEPEPPRGELLSTWRSPTESLLRSPSGSLLNSTPRFGEFYFPLDSLSALPLHETGGKDNEG